MSLKAIESGVREVGAEGSFSSLSLRHRIRSGSWGDPWERNGDEEGRRREHFPLFSPTVPKDKDLVNESNEVDSENVVGETADAGGRGAQQDHQPPQL